jgi:hypothetical protein
MLANSVSDPGLHIIKAGQSVYIPQVGPSDPSFSVMLAQVLPGVEPTALPAGTIPVYDANGNSVGYISNDGSLVSSPNVTPNLSNFVPGSIPPEVTIPPDGTPVFASRGQYRGYFGGDRPVAAILPGGDGIAGVAVGGPGAGAETGAGVGLLVGLGVIGLGVGLGVSQSGGNDKASPSVP